MLVVWEGLLSPALSSRGGRGGEGEVCDNVSVSLGLNAFRLTVTQLAEQREPYCVSVMAGRVRAVLKRQQAARTPNAGATARHRQTEWKQ